MKYTLTEGATACGISRTTLFRAIKSGKVSAGRDANGNFIIEPAELHRVYPTIAQKQAEQQEKDQQAIKEKIRTGTGETAVLLAKLEGLETALQREQQHNEHLKKLFEQADQERRDAQNKLMALLTDQRLKPAQEQPAPAEPIKKRRWWQ
jgi:hypothetical protein